MSVRIAVLDDYQHAAEVYADWERVRRQAEVAVFHDHVDDPDELVARLAGFDAVCFMRERTPLRAEQIDRLPRLKLIVTTAMGNAAIDISHAKSRGIQVCGTEFLQNGTPELIWGLILNLARGLLEEVRSVQSGGWQTRVGRDLQGSVIGILGLGRIGSRVARVAQAFEMSVLAWSPNLTEGRAREHGATWVPREELFSRSDFLVICMPLRSSTAGLVGAGDLRRMKLDAYLINTSRAGLVDEAALVEALREQRIAGAGLDVHAIEPLPRDHPFRSLPNVLATPHIGYVTHENYRLFHGQTVEAVLAWLAGTPVREVQVQLLGA